MNENKSDKKILLSGVKPTGRPHLGNYFGAMKQFVDNQDSHESYIFVADLHAMNSIQNGSELKQGTIDIVLDYLAIGLDPSLTTMFIQSAIPATFLKQLDYRRADQFFSCQPAV